MTPSWDSGGAGGVASPVTGSIIGRPAGTASLPSVGAGTAAAGLPSVCTWRLPCDAGAPATVPSGAACKTGNGGGGAASGPVPPSACIR